MNIDMNESRSLATTDKLRARAVCTLKCTVIAGIILACSESSSPASSQELPQAPTIKQLTEEEAKRFKDLLSKEGYGDIRLVAISYGEKEQETLLVLQFYPGEGTDDEEVGEGDFQIPSDGTDFNEAVVLYTGSPVKAKTCGGAQSGSRSCNTRSFCVVGGTPMSPCPTG